MKRSLKGHDLPESWAEAQQLAYAGKLKYIRCCNCHALLHSRQAAYSTEGWRESQISGICEPCFDSTFAEIDHGELA